MRVCRKCQRSRYELTEEEKERIRETAECVLTTFGLTKEQVYQWRINRRLGKMPGDKPLGFGAPDNGTMLEGLS